VVLQLLSAGYSALTSPPLSECVLCSRETGVHAGELCPEQVQKLISALEYSVDVQTNNKSIGDCRCFVSVFLKCIFFFLIC